MCTGISLQAADGSVVVARTVEWGLGDAHDAVFEAFRILDSFNNPVGVTAPAGRTAGDIVSATQVTTVCDLAHRAVCFHTMANRQVRRIDLRRIDFATVAPQVLESGAGREQAVLDVLPEG